LASVTLALEAWITQWMGPVANHPVVGALTPADLAAALLYLIVTFLVWAIAARRLHVLSRRAATSAEDPKLPHHVAAAANKPLYVLIWVYGLYIAATPLLLKGQGQAGFSELRKIMDLIFNLGAFLALFWALFRATRIVEARLARWAAGTPGKIDDLLVPLLGTALRISLVIIAIILGLPLIGLPPQSAGLVGKLSSISFIVAVAVLLFRAVSIAQRLMLGRYDIGAADNLRARHIYTQINIISRMIYVAIGLIAVGAILMLFEEVRHVGTSLLASAGIASVVVGIAAQKTLSNVFAGFQIALAQPVRQDDVVIVEGEWGRVEEITLTYIVVHIWDDRRLVLPLSYFIEKPFQNWTRNSAALLGSVFVWVDYSFPMEEGRAELKRIIESSPLWDKRFWNLQVSDSTEKSMQLRILATSANSSNSWDLRCEIREKFIAYIQRRLPDALPRLRLEPEASTAASENSDTR
jgi:small-conductance mechanosensitive channel